MDQVKIQSPKKLLLGCGISIITILVLGTIAVYFLNSKTDFFKQSFDSEPRNYSSLLEKDDFEKPADQRITEEDLVQYIQTAEQIRSRIEKKFAEENIPVDWNNEKNFVNLVPKLYEIRKIQADVLQEYQFSPKKYIWITRQLVVIHGGATVKQINLLIATTESEQPTIDVLRELRQIPQHNLDLFSKYEDGIEKAVQLWILMV